MIPDSFAITIWSAQHRLCRCRTMGWLVAALVVAVAAADRTSLARIANLTRDGGVEGFAPRMEFERWRPLTGRGDPLRNDPTYDYEPPVLERVRYWPSEPRPDPRPERLDSDVLVLGVSARRPGVRPPHPELRRRYPDSVLVPPPPPPRTTPHPTAPLYAMHEATLVYHSSTVDGERITYPLMTVTSDYAGWGPTTPVDMPLATDALEHNLIPGVRFDPTERPYAFYRPMLSEAPPPPPPIVLVPDALSTNLDLSSSTDSTGTPYITEVVDYGRDTETTTVNTPPFAPTAPPPPSSTVAPPLSTPAAPPAQLHMLAPMMSMPLDSPEDERPASASVPSMYLIIQGHSKVKTYGSKLAPASLLNSIRDEDPKSTESRQVKHLHPRREERMTHGEIKLAPGVTTGGLRALVVAGVGGTAVQEANLGIEYDVSDGGDVPAHTYRRGIVESELRRPGEHRRRRRRRAP